MFQLLPILTLIVPLVSGAIGIYVALSIDTKLARFAVTMQNELENKFMTRRECLLISELHHSPERRSVPRDNPEPTH